MAGARCAVPLLILLASAVMILSNSAASAQEVTPMLQMLDAMQQLMTGGGQYDREYYQKLRTCMDTFDPALQASQDGAWQGIITYWEMGGGPDDPWGGTGLQTRWMEDNATNTDFLNMTIYEPCNYASNVAYYHDVTEFCNRLELGSPFIIADEYVNALGKAFSALGIGSSFMHGTHTRLGGQQDTRCVAIVAYIIHQASLSGLEGVSSVLTDISETPRAMTGIELADDFFNMYLSMPVVEWFNHTNSLDIPNYYLTFAGIFSTVLTMAFPPETVDQLVPFLCDMFSVPADIQLFITDQYLPEMRIATANLDLGIVERTKFIKNSLATVGKLIYAFLWQEEELTDNSIFFNETVNGMGWEFLPVLNTRLNEINTYDYFEVEFQNGTDIYPGDVWCNPVIPHAKWHLESGLGLLDLVYLSDEMYRLLSSLQ